MTLTSLRTTRTSALLVLWMLFCVARGAEPAPKEEAPKKKHIEHVQGSRFVPVHRITLKNEEGKDIKPDDEGYLSFRLKTTCGKCHVYPKIASGWHFNAVDPKVDPGRPGQPWFVVHQGAVTVIPVSYRKWPGTYRPDDLGMTPRVFVKTFGHHLPGGGPGELTNVEDPDALWHISGPLEVNCFDCHSADRSYDHIKYFLAVAVDENFQWAPAAGLTEQFKVTGSTIKAGATYMPDMGPADDEQAKNAPRVIYDKKLFDAKNEVFFDIARPPLNSRCYFCHSSRTVGEGSTAFFKSDQDVHMRAGMNCTDCHRNGEDHNIRRGYEGEPGSELDPALDSLSCRGCHMGGGHSPGGRMGAPVPEHRGIPPHHFEKLSCTACHAGPYPEASTRHVQTSQAHGLEFQGAHRKDDTAPLIVEPVYAPMAPLGLIVPQRMVWPAYWAREKDGKITPIKPEEVVARAERVLAAASEKDEKQLNEARIIEILELLAADAEAAGQPVYISGGKLYRCQNKKLQVSDHEAARPVAWAIGHNVRPAAEALGAKGCTECHGANAPFFFGEVRIPTLASLPGISNPRMYTFMNEEPEELEAWALSYKFRTFFKCMGYTAAAVIALVLLAYGMYGVRGLSNWLRRHLSPGGRSE